MAIRAISKVCEAYKHDKTKQPHFEDFGAMVYDQRRFYLAATIDAPEANQYDATGVLGVDLGIVNLAVDSDGTSYKGGRRAESHGSQRTNQKKPSEQRLQKC